MNLLQEARVLKEGIRAGFNAFMDSDVGYLLTEGELRHRDVDWAILQNLNIAQAMMDRLKLQIAQDTEKLKTLPLVGVIFQDSPQEPAGQ
jgi:hypothetical protein